jgi:hypothetical protein
MLSIKQLKTCKLLSVLVKKTSKIRQNVQTNQNEFSRFDVLFCGRLEVRLLHKEKAFPMNIPLRIAFLILKLSISLRRNAGPVGTSTSFKMRTSTWLAWYAQEHLAPVREHNGIIQGICGIIQRTFGVPLGNVWRLRKTDLIRNPYAAS